MRPVKIDLTLVKNHENCFNAEYIETDAAISFAKLYRSGDFFNLTIPYRVTSTKTPSEIIYSYTNLIATFPSISFILLIARIEPKILWLQIHSANIDPSAVSILWKAVIEKPGNRSDETTRFVFQLFQQESDSKVCSVCRGLTRDAFRVPQTVEFHLRRPTRRQGVAKPRFSSGTSGANSFLSILCYPLILFADVSPSLFARIFLVPPFGQLFGSDRQFAWTTQWQLVMAVSLFRIRHRYPLGNEAPVF